MVETTELFIGLDVSKESHAVAVACQRRSKIRPGRNHKWLTIEDSGSEARVDECLESLSLDREFGRLASEHVQGCASNGCEVPGGVVLSGPAFILAKGDIE